MGDKKTYFIFSFVNAIFNVVIFAYLSAGLDWIYHEAVNWLSGLVARLVYGSIIGFKSFYRMRFNARSNYCNGSFCDFMVSDCLLYGFANSPSPVIVFKWGRSLVRGFCRE